MRFAGIGSLINLPRYSTKNARSGFDPNMPEENKLPSVLTCRPLRRLEIFAKQPSSQARSVSRAASIPRHQPGRETAAALNVRSAIKDREERAKINSVTEVQATDIQTTAIAEFSVHTAQTRSLSARPVSDCRMPCPGRGGCCYDTAVEAKRCFSGRRALT
jgi:hypothetical protein